jgi:23S rRNA (cytidine1920-2'-O)/16S rRNA (cytidine1409-2'-O)-methyltransferase
MERERIDKLLHERGFADSRTRAQAMVLAGVVLVSERRVEKPSEMVAADADIRIKGADAALRYVGRGGLKLEHALREFRIDPKGWTCLDIGSSTGGFTDCLLQHGAARVVGIDSGTNQLDWRLRSDPRVEVRENTNARYLSTADFDQKFDLAVVDVSFISVTKILPALVPLLKAEAAVIVLIKPQFEVGKDDVGKGGIVRDPELQNEVVVRISEFAVELGLETDGVIESPILGARGNREFLALYRLPMAGAERRPIEGDDYYFEAGLMVLTEAFLRRRGTCCRSGCRHCPYGFGKEDL